MLLHLHALLLALRSNNDRITEQWRGLFDFDLAQSFSGLSDVEPDIALEAELVSSLPPAPAFPSFYLTIDPPLAVYATGVHRMLLRLSNKAQIQLTLSDSETLNARILVTNRAINDGSFEDITTFALAPLLRRHGLFMIHAFTAVYNKKAVMFVGPSGSGKTSCGMALTAAGWQLLANDVALMRREDTSLVLLSPGTVHVSPATFSLLPSYGHLFDKYSQNLSNMKVSVPRLEFLQDEPVQLSAPIKAVYFPSIGDKKNHEIEAVPRAVGLARLMESSMDQWDQETWEDHIRFLEHLSYNVVFYSLHLGRDMSSLPAFLEQDLFGN